MSSKEFDALFKEAQERYKEIERTKSAYASSPEYGEVYSWLIKLLASEFSVIVFRIGMPTALLNKGIAQALQAHEVIVWAINNNKVADLKRLMEN